jgi:hypothetical protein
MVLAAALVVVAAALLIVAARGHRSMSYYTRDPQATTFERWYLGFFSNVGSALWWASTGIALFAAVALRRYAKPDVVAFLFGIALVTGVFGFDDMFGIHDGWGYQVGLPEWPFFALYGVLAAVIFARFWRDVARSWVAALIGAVTLYGVSTLADWAFGGSTSDLRYLAEDGLKLLAIVCWTGWVAAVAFDAIRGVIGANGGGGSADSTDGTAAALTYD